MDGLLGALRTVEAQLQPVADQTERWLKEIAGVTIEVPPLALVAVAVFIAALVLLIIKAVFTGGRRSSTVLLLGTCGVGKTALFYRLKMGKDVETHTSMKENEGNFVFHSERGTGAAKVHLVDIPGHNRLRSTANQFLPQAQAVLFVIDSVDPRLREAAEHLFELLSNKSMRQRRLPVLLCLNKSELVNALDEAHVKTALERELQSLRQTLKAMPRDERSEVAKVGVEGKEFKFEHVPNKVSFARCSAKAGDTRAIEAFVRRFVR